jgi:hypothetical protein
MGGAGPAPLHPRANFVAGCDDERENLAGLHIAGAPDTEVENPMFRLGLIGAAVGGVMLAAATAFAAPAAATAPAAVSAPASATATSPVQQVYWWRGRYYRYYWHGGYYPYYWHGGYWSYYWHGRYYHYRRWQNGVWFYY